MVRNFCVSLILLCSFSALAQRENTFYVAGFAGSDVGAKTVNAQAACVPNLTCVIVFDPTLAAYAVGTMPGKCAFCVWQDFRSVGSALGLYPGVTSDGLQGLIIAGSVSVIGRAPLYNIAPGSPSGSHNVALGAFALPALTTGYQNTAIGNYSLQADTTGMWNVAVGMASQQNYATGSNNTSIGVDTLIGASNPALNTGYQNTALGSQVLQFNSSGYFNTGCGVEALWQNTTGFDNTGCGVSNLSFNVGGSLNTAFGTNSQDNGVNNTLDTSIGVNALYGYYITPSAYSYSAGTLTFTGTNVLQVGQTIAFNVQVPIGAPAALAALNGVSLAVSASSGSTFSVVSALVPSSGSIACNPFTPDTGGCLFVSPVHIGNSAVGYGSLQNIGPGGYNFAGGWLSLTALFSGMFNTSLGSRSCASLLTSSQNTCLGAYSLNNATTSQNETAVGFRAGAIDDATQYDVSGANNTWVGASTGPASVTPQNNSTALGFGAVTAASNQVQIGNTAVTDIFMGQTALGVSPTVTHMGESTAHYIIQDANGTGTPGQVIWIRDSVDAQFDQFWLYSGKTAGTSANLHFGDGVDGDGRVMSFLAGATKVPLTLNDSGNAQFGGAVSGPASRIGTFVCTAGGSIVVGNTNELISSMVTFSLRVAGGTITTSPAMKAVTAGTGFTVLCGATDTSTYNYWIWN